MVIGLLDKILSIVEAEGWYEDQASLSSHLGATGC